MDHIFYLSLENDVCSARAAILDHPYHLAYHVLFEDGYENVFFTDVETGNWVEEDLGETSLASQFGIKLGLLSSAPLLPHKTLTWCRATVAGSILNFGFYSYMDARDTIFEVYADNHKFLYLFRYGASGWNVYDTRYRIAAGEYTDRVKIIIGIFKGLAENI